MAAAGLLLLGCGLLLGIWLSGQVLSPPAKRLADVSPEYAALESHYQAQLAAGLGQLAALPVADNTVVQDLAQMEATYRDLQNELAATPGSTEAQIVQAMIENYRARLAILERVLERLNADSIPNRFDNYPSDDNDEQNI